MLISLRDNRVRRAYRCCGIIDAYTEPSTPDRPEDWVASCTEAFNAGVEKIEHEGLSLDDKGAFLRDRILREPERFLGKKAIERYGTGLSILVKLLDAGERLFIQCHPTDDFAQKSFRSQFGKTECWFMIHTEPEACVYLGFKPGITREYFCRLFEEQNIPAMLEAMHRIPVKEGDVVFVEGGVPHAIGKGCFLVELQQPTDLMVIPERTGETGRTLPDEKLHGGLGFEHMMDCFNFTGLTESELRKRYIRHADPVTNGVQTVIGQDLTDRFSMEQLTVNGSLTQVCNEDSYRVIAVLEGEGTLSDGTESFPVKKGSKFFVCADTERLFWKGTHIKAVICKP